MNNINAYIKKCVMEGNLVECTKEEYPFIRSELQKVAGWMIDNNQGIRVTIALNEVKRLDKLFFKE